jgi:RimJ/RimL family protein N-acetyltransferase
MRGRAQRLTRANEREALEYLAFSPYENVFLTWMIRNDRSTVTRSGLFAYGDRSGTVGGVAFFGRQIVLSTQDRDAIETFAHEARAFRFERMILGPSAVVGHFWEHIAPWHEKPRLVRERQPLLAIERRTLRASSSAVRVRQALQTEWETVAQNSAQMIAHELDYDPRTLTPEFNANVRTMIARGLWWVGECDGEICFLCNAGPFSDYTLQLQGIWTPPHLRGKGYATAALGGICDRLLRDFPTLSLYVNDFNEEALRLYARIGFRQVGEMRTLLF